MQNPDSGVAMALVPLVVLVALESATSYSLVDSPELGAVAMDLADLGMVAREHYSLGESFVEPVAVVLLDPGIRLSARAKIILTRGARGYHISNKS